MKNIARTLDNLHISQYEDENKTEEEGRREIATKIQECIPQALVDCSTDRNQKSILSNAIQGKDWTLHVASSTNFSNLSYYKLLHELQNALQQYSLHKQHSPKHEGEFVRQIHIAETNFTQGRYFPLDLTGHGRTSATPRKRLKLWSCCTFCRKMST